MAKVIIGMLFLFNPVFSIIDFLPDCIGYYLIFSGLSKLSDLNVQINEARSGFQKLFYINIGKLACVFLLPSVDTTWRLVFTFSFMVLELIFFFVTLPSFFDGLFGVSTRYGGVEKNIKSSEIITMTWVFFIAKEVLSLLPELMCLFEYTETGTVEAYTVLTPANYRVILHILNAVVTTVLGVIWYIMMKKYLSFYKSEEFTSAVDAAYNAEIAQNAQLLTYRSIKSLCAFFSCGVFFIIGIYVNNINFIPDAVFALLAAIGLISVKKLFYDKASVALCFAFGVAALAQLIVSSMFFVNYNTADSTTGFAGLMMIVVERDMTAKVFYAAGAALAVIEMVLLSAFTFRYSRVFVSICEKYALRDTNGSVQISGMNDEIMKNTRKSFTAVKAVSVLLVISCALQQALYFTMPVLWIPTFFVSLAYALLVSRAISSFKKNIQDKFMIE